MADNKDKKVLNVPALRFPEFNGEWITRPIKDIADFIGGGTPSSANEAYWQGTIPWVSSSDIVEDNINDITISRYITEEAISNSATKLCSAPVILIVSRVGVGKVALSSKAICTSQDFCNLINIKVHPTFLAYSLSQIMKRKSIEVQGTSIKGITSLEIQKIILHIPSLQEQHKISDLFQLIDKRIAVQSKIIEKYESLIQAMCDTLIGKEEQQVMLSFNEFGQSYSGLSGKSADDFGEGYPYITYMNVYQNQIIDSTDIGLVKINETEQQSVVRYGDILLTLSSETPEEVGMGAVYLGETYPMYLNSFCFGIHITDESKIYPPFLTYYVSSQLFRKTVYPLAQGSTRFNLQKNDFMKKKFSFPVIEKQRQTYSILKNYSDKLIVEKQIMRLLCNQKCYLLRQLFI